MKKNILFLLVIIMSSCLPVRITHRNEVKITKDPQRIDVSEFKNLKGKFQLDTISPAWNDLGSLSPSVPIAFGEKYGYDGQGIFKKGCMFPSHYTLIVKTDTGYLQLKTFDDIKNFYAPIESKEEALSYSILCTGYYPQYNFDIPLFYRKYKTIINTTYVVKNDNVYEVQLFYYQLCGCGPHYHYAVVLRVSEKGDILSEDYIKLYKNPKEDKLCVD